MLAGLENEAIFTAPSYKTTKNINGALPSGSLSIVENKVTISGGGGNIGGATWSNSILFIDLNR